MRNPYSLALIIVMCLKRSCQATHAPALPKKHAGVKALGTFRDRLEVQRTFMNVDGSNHTRSFDPKSSNPSDVIETNKLHVPLIFIPQCQVDGFWSNVRQLAANLWFLNQLRDQQHIFFAMVLPTLMFHVSGNFRIQDYVEFDLCFDRHRLETYLNVSSISRAQFNADKARRGILIEWPGTFRCQKGGQLVGVDWESFAPWTTHTSHHSLSDVATIVEAGRNSRIILAGSPGPERGLAFEDVRFHLNASLPMFFRQITTVFHYLRFSPLIERAATCVLQHWGLSRNSTFLAVHVRRGEAIHIKGVLGQATDLEMDHAFQKARDHSCGNSSFSAIILSSMDFRRDHAFFITRTAIPVFGFDEKLHNMIARTVPGMTGCTNIMCKDLVEVAVWLRASAFIGSRSTMSEMAYLMRMQRKGESQSDHCSFDAQPCYVRSDSYYNADALKRSACSPMCQSRQSSQACLAEGNASLYLR